MAVNSVLFTDAETIDWQYELTTWDKSPVFLRFRQGSRVYMIPSWGSWVLKHLPEVQFFPCSEILQRYHSMWGASKLAGESSLFRVANVHSSRDSADCVRLAKEKSVLCKDRTQWVWQMWAVARQISARKNLFNLIWLSLWNTQSLYDCETNLLLNETCILCSALCCSLGKYGNSQCKNPFTPLHVALVRDLWVYGIDW